MSQMSQMSGPPPYTRDERRALTVRVVVPVLLGVVAVAVMACTAVMGYAGFDTSRGSPDTTSSTTRVTKVVDGDTIEVRVQGRTERVRLIGIDTPETKDPRKPVQCFGKEASARTAELLPPGTAVRLVRDVEERDSYDRLLAYVYRSSDGLFVNLELAQGGYADLLTYPPNVAHTGELRAAVDEARREQRGLWQACGGAGKPA